MQYDALNRLTATTKQVQNSLVNNNAVSGVVNISTQQYDALGQLSTKQLGNTKNSSGYTANPLETLAYDYNIRGWLLGINRAYVKDLSTASTFLGEGFTTPAAYSAGNYFGFELGYDKAPTVGAATWGSAANYNGNITGMIWKSVHDGQIRKYNFSYDAVNRLTAANFTQYFNSSFNDSSGVDYTTNNLSYDANGNILSMNQYGLKTPVATSSVLIDQLSYTYQPGSNKLQKVTDAANDSSSVLGDFKYLQSAKSDTDYVYDLNGNVIADKNKNISNIAYNILNLPQTITVAGKGTITYTYDAAGNKLRKQTVEGTKTTTTLYAGGIVYENDTLRFIPHEEGRTRINNNTNYVFDYYLKDHLGNVRMTITDDITQPIPVIDATSYYPFGLTMSGVSVKALYKLENDKKYNGIELNEDLGLNIYDAFFRNLDPQIGRWWEVDPKVDDGYENYSPYISMYDNPAKYSDLLGDEADDDPGYLSVTGNFLKGIGQSALSTVQGLANALAHPIETVSGIGNAISHPIETGSALVAAIKVDYNDFKNGNTDVKANILGKVIGDVAQIAVGGELIKASTNLVKGIKVVEETAAASKSAEIVKGLGNPFKSATLSEVRASFEKRVANGTMEKKGPNAYVNKSGYSYNVDKGGTYGRRGKKVEAPHIDVNYSKPKPKNLPGKKKLEVKNN
jgi:RHS repeat-associated protein